MENGTPQEPQKPCIKVFWDQEHQNVALAFDHAEFKSWPFVISCLEMAKTQADQQMRVQQAAHMQKQLMEQQRAQAVANRLLRG